MDPLYQISCGLGAFKTKLYSDHLSYKQAGKHELNIPITQIIEVTPKTIAASVVVKLKSGRTIDCTVPVKEKQKICELIIQTKQEKIEQDAKNGISHDADPLWEPRVACPKCGSTQITANQQGFGAGKALAGAVLTGGLGLLFGFAGSRDVQITCLACGMRFPPTQASLI